MIGLMGGTFSPIHYGHLLMCESIREEFDLKKVIFMPAKRPPHKDASQIAEASDRLAMVSLAIEDNPFFEVSDLEMKREGASYTVDTLRELKWVYGDEETLGLIVGADSLVQIHTWKSYEEILRLATLIVAKRPDTDEEWLDKSIHELETQNSARILKASASAMNFSSTEIRERFSKGYSIRYRVPEKVEAYMKERNLYR
ncbi:MAG: nicotinate-nucleotide adenylyltransferase [Clostridia bacterium]|nr:nicotinate-nucleotide adenylyltransferase [Clostridia bacterium]